MSELLIYNKDNWMDALTPEEVTERSKTNKHFQDNYDSRYQWGDIVEVQPDGFWNQRGFNKLAFSVVKLPGESEANSRKLMEEENDGATPIHKRRYHFTIYPDQGKETTTTLASTDIRDKVDNSRVTDLGASIG